jgi:muconate/chloromuconate cycloisomerase
MSGPHVSRIDTEIVDLPMRRGHRFAGHEIHQQAYLVVTLRTDSGHLGIGEGVSPGGPWWSGESIEGQRQMIEHYLAPALVGVDVLDPWAATTAMDRVAHGNEFAKSALETALLDAAARALGVPAHTLIGGGATRDRLPVRWALSASGDQDVAQEATERLALGHHALKLKMGALPPDEDVRRATRLIDKIGVELDYLADPNGSWDCHTATWAARELEAAGVRILEQPVERTDIQGMAELRARCTRMLLMADESICRPRDALRVAAARACDAVSLKPGKSGGLRRAVQVATITEAAGMMAYGGTAIETSIGTAAAAHLFATLPTLPLGTELIGPLLLVEDLTTTPVRYSDGDLLLPTGPGLGVELDPDQVGRFRRTDR